MNAFVSVGNATVARRLAAGIFVLAAFFSWDARAQTCSSQPINSSPAAGASNVSTTVTLEWEHSTPQPDSYDIVWGPTSAGTNCSTLPNRATVTGDTTHFNPPPLDSNTQYLWSIIAKRAGCPDVQSSCTTFTTSATASCSTVSATLEAPAAGATVSNPVTFSWDPVDGATSYQVWVTRPGSASSKLTTTTSTAVQLSAPNGEIQWFVDTVFDSSCPVTQSAARSLTVGAPCPTIAPANSSPAPGATGVANPVSFTWSAVDGVDHYEIWGESNTGSTTGPSLLGTTNHTNFQTEVPGGSSFSWFVRAIFSTTSCAPTQSAATSFTPAAGATCPTSGPVLTSPDNGVTVSSPVHFSWQGISGAVGYQVDVVTNGQTTSIATTDTSTTQSLPSGSAEWSVTAFFQSCTSVTSSSRHFTVSSSQSCGSNPSPTRRLPADGSTQPTLVQFSWDSVPGAIGYSVMGGSSSSTKQDLGDTTGTSLTVSLPPGEVDWSVIAFFDGCPFTESNSGRFTVQSTTCSTTPASLVTPSDGAEDVASPVTFSWSAVAGASRYRIWVVPDGGSPTLAGSTENTSLSTDLASGEVSWYVETIFPGCDPVLSVSRRFSVAAMQNCSSNTAPVILSPADGATSVSSPVTLTWASVNGAFAYSVALSVDGRGMVNIGTTRATSLTLDLRGSSVEWTVAALFSGCSPQVSQESHFTLAPAPCDTSAPSLVAPADNASVLSPVQFNWTPEAGARRYRLWITTADGQEILAAETSATDVSRIIPPGSFSWHVVALFGDCGSKRSVESRFTIAQPDDCADIKPVTLTPDDGAIPVDGGFPFVLSWTSVADSIGYEVWVARGDGSYQNIGFSRDTSMTVALPSASYVWFVKALFKDCEPTRSDPSHFDIGSNACEDHQRPVNLTPAHHAVAASPVSFSWIGIPDATTYDLHVSVDEAPFAKVVSTDQTSISVPVPPGEIRWFVTAHFVGCPLDPSAITSFFAVPSPACDMPDAPDIQAIGHVSSGISYNVQWSSVANAGIYELQEATSPSFADATTTPVSGISALELHVATSVPVTFYYRVRAVSDCSDQRGTYSSTGTVTISPRPAGASTLTSIVPLGAQSIVVQTIFLPGSSSKTGATAASTSFTATSDQPWLRVQPSSGAIPPEGITLAIIEAVTSAGTHQGNISIVTSSTGVSTETTPPAAPPVNLPVSVSLVAPVTPPQSSPSATPDALIIPAVAHTNGQGSSVFVTDMRLSNVSPTIQTYQLSFAPSGTSSITASQSTTVQVQPGETVALNDVLPNWFGLAPSSPAAAGSLTIRPSSSTSSSSTGSVSTVLATTTVASSRTYSSSPNGTFGQFVPAVPLSQFVRKGKKLSLQQIAQSDAFRTNFGFVEGSGEPATVLMTIYGDDGSKVTDFTISLAAGEQVQPGQILRDKGITLADGRAEVEVTSDTGSITAYASVLDNLTNDPLLVSPIDVSQISASRYVIPGVADLQNGTDSWRTDVRIYNGAPIPQTATMTFYPAGSPATPQSVQLSFNPGEVKALNDVLRTTFGLAGTLGAIHVTTSTASQLVTSARTYNLTSNGTYGQFIPGVTPDHAIGLGDRPLQVLQAEQSPAFHTNLGIAEMTGNPVTVEVTAIVPGALSAPVVRLNLEPFEFLQITKVLASFGMPAAYDARLTVSVVNGAGRVTAYGSMVDESTNDPTYVPAQ